jgi:hypothetical protein
VDLADEFTRAIDAIAERPSTWPLWPAVGEDLGVRRFLLACRRRRVSVEK